MKATEHYIIEAERRIERAETAKYELARHELMAAAVFALLAIAGAIDDHKEREP